MRPSESRARDRYEWATVQCGMYFRRQRQWIGYW